MLTTEESTLDDRPLVSPRYTARLLQTTFFIIFGLATVLLLAIEFEVVANLRYVAAIAMVTIATLLPLLRGFQNPYYRPWMLALPILDFLAFFIIRLDGTGGVTNPMVMMLALPAVWVGVVKSRRAIAILVPFVLAVIAPDVLLLARGRLEEANADRAIMLIAVFPVVMLLTMVVAYMMSSILAGRQVELSSEQRRRAAAARETERTRRLLDTVLDALDVGVIVTSPTGERVLMNRVLRESPELTANDADPWDSFRRIRTLSTDRVTPIDAGDSSFDRVMRGQQVTDRLVWVGIPGGRQSALSVSAAPVHTADGEHLANVVLVKDVTDFMQALESKDAFIGTVSHELRTPLTTMAGFLELVLERRDELAQLDPEIVSWLEVMDRNVQRQHMLVRDLLTAAGSRNAPIAIARHSGDLAAVVRESAAALRSEAAASGVRLTVTGRDAIGRFDALRMAQVAENLITNAVRYTPEGGRVRVSASADETHLLLVVRDTGIGITPEDQERLFEQFFRAADARASAIRGVGLGLPIVKAIVDAHVGSIELDSEVGAGTTITVRLPR
ncbi:ATP-binding protein [Microcella daejeonensis]|uniref:sensor histidine kinase n=1 Tax=Microcella daejeonensis TaxID=2994971 RepID=UPI00226EBF03|nr:ATP-binding protein [Microcella daejeonensis]WAB84733.1 ATP-binding protein [Microcella daejeonensis]